MQAREVFKVKPEGNYVFIKGSGADPNADFLFSGQMEVLKEAIDAGKIKNVGEAYTDGWLPANAQKNMEQFLTANDNKVDAVVASNDGTAGGVVAALDGAGPCRLRSGFRPGRRQCRAEPRRARHADRVGLEGRARTRQERGRNRLAARRRQADGRDRRRRSTSPRRAAIEMQVGVPDADRRSPRTTSTSSSTPAGSPRTWSAQGVAAGTVAACN